MRALVLVGCALATLVGCGGGSGGGGGAAVRYGGARVAASASTAFVHPGDTFTVEVAAIDLVPHVYAADLRLRYDPALVEFVSADTSASAISGGTDACALRGGAPGVVVFGRSKRGAALEEDIRGEIARFAFRAKAAGTARVEIAALHLVDTAGLDQPVVTPGAASVSIAP
jgi:hypothetical protein